MSKKNVTAESLATAWARYHDLFGINPLGSLKQMAAAAQPADGALREGVRDAIIGKLRFAMVRQGFFDGFIGHHFIDGPEAQAVEEEVAGNVLRALAAQPADGALRDGDVFDFVGLRISRHVIDTCIVFDGMKEPFRAGAISAIEEFYFRVTGKHLDWEEIRERALAAQTQEKK